MSEPRPSDERAEEDEADPDPDHREPIRTRRAGQEVEPASERDAGKARSVVEDVHERPNRDVIDGEADSDDQTSDAGSDRGADRGDDTDEREAR